MIAKSKLENHFGNIKKSRFEELATQWEAEKSWKEKSQHIALELLDFLDENNLTQKAFAKLMGVSPQVINKWLKGQENFTLETIGKMETILQRHLIEVGTRSTESAIMMEELEPIATNYSWNKFPASTYFKPSAKIVPIAREYNSKVYGC